MLARAGAPGPEEKPRVRRVFPRALVVLPRTTAASREDLSGVELLGSDVLDLQSTPRC
jgi:hypothetical protein